MIVRGLRRVVPGRAACPIRWGGGRLPPAPSPPRPGPEGEGRYPCPGGRLVSPVVRAGYLPIFACSSWPGITDAARSPDPRVQTSRPRSTTWCPGRRVVPTTSTTSRRCVTSATPPRPRPRRSGLVPATLASARRLGTRSPPCGPCSRTPAGLPMRSALPTPSPLLRPVPTPRPSTPRGRTHRRQPPVRPSPGEGEPNTSPPRGGGRPLPGSPGPRTA